MANDVTTLYRPVGLYELQRIIESGMRAFPPRLPEQPIFYPVLGFDYATQIAKEWNTGDERSGYAGFVTQFDVDSAWLAGFEIHQVGARDHLEYWIPAETLEEFNRHIQGCIQVAGSWFGDQYRGPAPEALEAACVNREEGISQ